jgi:hypothetical protein
MIGVKNMPLCAKCRKFMPPEFCEPAEESDFLCLFCIRDVNEIWYGEGKQKKATREEIEKEYQIFTRELREKLLDPFAGDKEKRKLVKGVTEKESRIIRPY